MTFGICKHTSLIITILTCLRPNVEEANAHAPSHSRLFREVWPMSVDAIICSLILLR